MYTSAAMKQLWIAMVVLSCCGLNSAAQDRVVAALDSLPSIKSIDQVAISPDGAQVAYIVGGELSVASTVNGAAHRIAPSQNATREVTWSADSHYLAWFNDLPATSPRHNCGPPPWTVPNSHSALRSMAMRRLLVTSETGRSFLFSLSKACPASLARSNQ